MGNLATPQTGRMDVCSIEARHPPQERRACAEIRTVKLFRLLKAPEIAEKITEYIPLSEQLGLIATIAKIMLGRGPQRGC